jgi:hypothetical protein
VSAGMYEAWVSLRAALLSQIKRETLEVPFEAMSKDIFHPWWKIFVNREVPGLPQSLPRNLQQWRQECQRLSTGERYRCGLYVQNSRFEQICLYGRRYLYEQIFQWAVNERKQDWQNPEGSGIDAICLSAPGECSERKGRTGINGEPYAGRFK